MLDPPAIPEQLLRRALAGELSALRELLVEHAALLEREVRWRAGRRVRLRESISDLTQSLIGDLLPELQRARFDDLADFRGWLVRAARHKLIDKERHHRARSRDAAREAPGGAGTSRDHPVDPGRSPSVAAMVAEDRAQLLDALEQLTPEQRAVVVMARLENKPHAQIAAALGRSEEACRMLLSRALVHVARLLDRDSSASQVDRLGRSELL